MERLPRLTSRTCAPRKDVFIIEVTAGGRVRASPCGDRAVPAVAHAGDEVIGEERWREAVHRDVRAVRVGAERDRRGHGRPRRFRRGRYGR